MTNDTKTVAELHDENAALRDDFAALSERIDSMAPHEETPAEREARIAEVEKAQEILDAIAGGRGGTMTLTPSRKEVEAAISTVSTDSRAEIAGRRGIAPDERQTMTVGLRGHVASLHECAEAYYEREGI